MAERRYNLDRKELIEADFPDIGYISEKIRGQNMELGCPGDSRVSTGRIWTDDEVGELRRRFMEVSLP